LVRVVVPAILNAEGRQATLAWEIRPTLGGSPDRRWRQVPEITRTHGLDHPQTWRGHTTRASSFEKVGGRNPSFAAGGCREMAAKAVRELTGFLAAYREAFGAMKSGLRDVLFPAGTWRLFRELGVNVISAT